VEEAWGGGIRQEGVDFEWNGKGVGWGGGGEGKRTRWRERVVEREPGEVRGTAAR